MSPAENTSDRFELPYQNDSTGKEASNRFGCDEQRMFPRATRLLAPSTRWMDELPIAGLRHWWPSGMLTRLPRRNWQSMPPPSMAVSVGVTWQIPLRLIYQCSGRHYAEPEREWEYSRFPAQYRKPWLPYGFETCSDIKLRL